LINADNTGMSQNKKQGPGIDDVAAQVSQAVGSVTKAVEDVQEGALKNVKEGVDTVSTTIKQAEQQKREIEQTVELEKSKITTGVAGNSSHPYSINTNSPMNKLFPEFFTPCHRITSASKLAT